MRTSGTHLSQIGNYPRLPSKVDIPEATDPSIPRTAMTTGASCASSQSELGRLAVFLTIDGNRGVGAQGEVDANVVVVDGAGVVEEVAPQSVGVASSSVVA